MKSKANAACFFATLLLASLIVMTNGADVSAEPQYVMTCGSCHGNPPLDGSTRDPNTGAFQGNHQRHVNVSNPALTLCNQCHNMTNNDHSHQDGSISFQAVINASPKSTAKYQGITFKNQTSIPVLGSCSDINCHFESVTPAWGSANFTASTVNCSACHASPGSSTGHSKHDAYYTFASNGCNKCHPDYSTSPTFQHATSAGNRGIKVKLAEGTYSGTGLNYLPSQSGSRTLGNCSNLYCHSNGTNNTTFTAQVTPSWGTTLNCNSCHVTGTTLSTGSHLRHVDSTISADFACYKCHTATVNSTGAVVSMADHVDRLVTVKYSNTSTAVNGTYNGVNASAGKTALVPGTRNATCTNIYCHSKGDSITAFAPMSTARWGGAMPANCRGCHGGDATQAATRRISSGVHTKHMATYSFGCADCHTATVSANTTISTPANHVDRKINVDLAANWGGTYSASGKLPGAATGTCNTTYCHSDGKQTSPAYIAQGWTGTLTCTGCHGNATSNTLSGVHAKHVNNSAVIGTNFGCVDCHALTVSNDTTISNLSKHVDKFRQYSGAKARGTSSYVTATGVCSNLYCHSNGKGTFKSMAAPNNWFGAGTLDCAGCHGSAATFGSPNYASGAAGSLTANSHSAHVKSSADCVKCHYKTTSTGTSIITGATDHIDKTLDARFSKLGTFTNLSGVYNNTTKSCSSTYCHGTGTAPIWGANGTLTCNSCHSSMGAGSVDSFVGAHSDHSNVYKFACEQCHATTALSPLTKAQHAAGGASATVAANVVFSNNSTVWKTIKYGDDATTNYKYRSLYTNPFVAAVTPSKTNGSAQTADKGFNWTAATCSNIWCHSNANPVGGTNSYATAPAWNTTISNCTSCHGNKTTVGGTGISAVHNRHVNTFGQGCVTCHSNTVATDTTLNATTGIAYHVNGEKDVNMIGGTYTKGSFTCSVAACHGGATPAWNNAASGACGTCHLATSATVGGLINQGGHFAHFSSAAAQWKNYGPNFVATNDSQCAQCHTGYTETASTHVNGTKNTTLTTCTSACHPSAGMPAPLTAWTAGTVTCESCHTGTASVINSIPAPLKGQFASYGHGVGNIGVKTGNACTDCHERNAKHLTRVLGDNNRLLAGMGTGLDKDVNTVCTYCHNTTTVGTQFRNLPGHFAASLDSKSAVGCRNCHDPHGSGTNSHMIKSQIAFFSTTTQSISFTGTEFVNLVTNRGLCQACHRSTKYYRAGVPETVHFTANCLQCHTHTGGGVAAFAPSACDSCHGFPPVARNVGYTINGNIGRLNNYTGAKFEDYSGGGGAHSVAAHVSPTVKPGDGFNACTTCHSLGSSSHNGTTPVKSNIANVTVKLVQTKQFKSGTLSIYSSAKFVAPPNNKTGSCFNLNCHIGKSLKWSTEK